MNKGLSVKVVAAALREAAKHLEAHGFAESNCLVVQVSLVGNHEVKTTFFGSLDEYMITPMSDVPRAELDDA